MSGNFQDFARAFHRQIYIESQVTNKLVQLNLSIHESLTYPKK